MRPCGLQPMKVLHCWLILRPHSRRFSPTNCPALGLGWMESESQKIIFTVMRRLYQDEWILQHCRMSWRPNIFSLLASAISKSNPKSLNHYIVNRNQIEPSGAWFKGIKSDVWESTQPYIISIKKHQFPLFWLLNHQQYVSNLNPLIWF